MTAAARVCSVVWRRTVRAPSHYRSSSMGGLAVHTDRIDIASAPTFGVVLLSDISGFTKLAEALSLGHMSNTAPSTSTASRSAQQRAGADSLVTIINSIFSRLIDVITSFGGDIIKFAGDAILTVFRPKSSSER